MHKGLYAKQHRTNRESATRAARRAGQIEMHLLGGKAGRGCRGNSRRASEPYPDSWPALLLRPPVVMGRGG